MKITKMLLRFMLLLAITMTFITQTPMMFAMLVEGGGGGPPSYMMIYRGTVYNSANGAVIPGASVTVSISGIGSLTRTADSTGFYYVMMTTTTYKSSYAYTITASAADYRPTTTSTKYCSPNSVSTNAVYLTLYSYSITPLNIMSNYHILYESASTYYHAGWITLNAQFISYENPATTDKIHVYGSLSLDDYKSTYNSWDRFTAYFSILEVSGGGASSVWHSPSNLRSVTKGTTNAGYDYYTCTEQTYTYNGDTHPLCPDYKCMNYVGYGDPYPTNVNNNGQMIYAVSKIYFDFTWIPVSGTDVPDRNYLVHTVWGVDGSYVNAAFFGQSLPAYVV
jgi:hypothetical protein